MALRRNLKFLRSQFFLTHPVQPDHCCYPCSHNAQLQQQVADLITKVWISSCLKEKKRAYFPTSNYLLNVFLGSTCPMRDLSCEAPDGSNVITTTTTIDDAECGGKFMILIYIFLETSCLINISPKMIII